MTSMEIYILRLNLVKFILRIMYYNWFPCALKSNLLPFGYRVLLGIIGAS
jgi:hypothetical protein